MEYILLLSFVVGLNFITNKLNKNYSFKNFNVSNIYIFSLFLLIIYILNAYLLVLNFNPKNLNLTIFFVIILTFFLNIKNLQTKKIFLFFKNENLLISLLLLPFFFIIAFPAIEEDSLRYHLPIAKKILNNSFYQNHWFDYITLGSQEFINTFFLSFNVANGSSILNYLYLILFLLNGKNFQKYNEEYNKLNILILISSPYLVSLLTSQKLYLVPSILATLIILELFFNKKKLNLSNLHILGSLMSFCLVTKATFLPFFLCFFLSFIFIEKDKKKLILYLFLQIIIFLVIFFPIFYLKYIIYKDPFLPYLSINPSNIEWFKEYNYWLTSFNMDLTDQVKNIFLKIFLIPIKLALPLHYSDIFKTLGLGVLFLFTINYVSKRNIWLTIFFAFNVFVLLNAQTRWFLPLLIFITIFASINKFKNLQFFIKLQSVFITLIIIPIAVLTIFYQLNIFSKSKIINIFSNSHSIIEELNKDYPESKIFTSHNSFFYFKNYIPLYHPEIMIKYEKNYYKDKLSKNDLVLWQHRSNKDLSKIKKIIGCKNLEFIKKFKIINSRFFLRKNYTELSLYRIMCTGS